MGGDGGGFTGFNTVGGVGYGDTVGAGVVGTIGAKVPAPPIGVLPHSVLTSSTILISAQFQNYVVVLY